jgi:hypothetical protein
MPIDTKLTEDELIQQIGNNAVREAQRKSLENGIPNVYSKNGVVYYQLPDGTITMQNPFEEKSKSLFF